MGLYPGEHEEMNPDELTDQDLRDLAALYDEEPSHWHAMLRTFATKELEKRHEKTDAYSANLAFRLRHARGG